MLFIETVEPGALTLRAEPRFMQGAGAMLSAPDVGALIRVLDGNRGEMKSLDGRFTARFNERDRQVRGKIGSRRWTLSIAESETFRWALRLACLELCRTRT